MASHGYCCLESGSPYVRVVTPVAEPCVTMAMGAGGMPIAMRRILVVPHALLTELSESFLDRRLLKLRSVKDAHEALAAAAVWPPDLIVLDSHVPGMSPLEFCRVVRAEPSLAETRLLMLTTEYGDQTDEISGAEVDAHLVAPVAQSQLLRTISVLMDVRRRRASRLRVELLARISDVRQTFEGESTSMLANILGLSESGLLLECERHLFLGTEVGVQFVLPGTNRQLDVLAIVLAADELQLQYGVEFVDFATEDRDTIRSFVAGQMIGRIAQSRLE